MEPVLTSQDIRYASADDLLREQEVETRDVKLPDGRLVKVRGLTRIELILSGKGDPDADEVERRNVSTCLLLPRMTKAQVGKWQCQPGSVMALARITTAIRDLSGLGEGAQKSDVAEVSD